VEKVDEYTVRINLTEPVVALPLRITGTTSAMLSPSTLADDGWLDSPIGTGAFKFVEYIDGDRIILERNEDYWGEPAKLEKVTFRRIPDATTRLAALQTGEIDAIADVGALLPEQASIVEDHEDLVLLDTDVSTTHYLTFNSGKPPFDDQRLRKAVAQSIDLQSLVDNTLYGYGDPGVSVITSRAKDWARTDVAQEYDPEAAMALAQEALGDDRVEARLVLHSGLLGRWPYESMAQIIQALVTELGIDVTIDVVEGGAWSEALKLGEYNMTMMPYTLIPADPDYFFGRWAWSEGFHNQGRSYGYTNDRVDELVKSAVSEPDPAERKAQYDELQAIIAEEVPFLPIYDEKTIYATRDTVKDFLLNVMFAPSIIEAYRVPE
jgi:peptide/nickel transport system substrate-binding protein